MRSGRKDNRILFPMAVEHLPYRIDPESCRFHRYEQLWKEAAFDLLLKESPSLAGWSHLDFG